jgi:SAM-dependent methyltransferase
MKTDDHDAKMTDVYKHIFTDRYVFHEKENKDIDALLSKNLVEVGLAPKDLQDRVVLNNGTGYETMAFHRLGAKQIFHYDISEVPVKNLQELSMDEKYSNITSQKADLCKVDYDIPGGIDVVYLSGAVHHFWNPEAAMYKLLPVLNKDARIFFRVYRSGSLKFFVSDFVKKFANFEGSKVIDEVFSKKFGAFLKDEGKTKENMYVHLNTVLYDDTFVPVLFLFDINKIDEFFELNGFKRLIDNDLPDYNHDDREIDCTMTSVAYQKISDRTDEVKGQFSGHINQLTDIEYKHPYIAETVALMEKTIPVLKDLPPEEQMDVVCDLFFYSDGYRSRKYYHKDGSPLHASDEEFAVLKTGEGVNRKIQELLRRYV